MFHNKSLEHTCLLQTLGMLFKRNSFFCLANFSFDLTPRNNARYSLISITQAVQCLNLNSYGFLVTGSITRFFFNNTLTGKKCVTKPNNYYFRYPEVMFITWLYNVLNSRNAYPHSNIWEYWILSPGVILLDASSFILYFRM